MDLENFLMKADKKNQSFSNAILDCLYHIKHDHRNQAHNIAEKLNSDFGNWLHALLHRIEGDEWNANYWYRQAGRKPYSGDFEQEWEEIARSYLS